MYPKVYGAAGQKKLAQYPERFMQAQQLQDTIPNIQDLNLDETGDLQSRLKRFYSELKAYEVSMRAVIGSYQSLIEEAERDCNKMEEVAMNTPPTAKPDRKFSLTTSIVQTRQQILFAKQQCELLNQQIENIVALKAEIKLAIAQNGLANLMPLLVQLKNQDAEIRSTPK